MLRKNYLFVIFSIPFTLPAQWSSNSSVNNSICTQLYNQQNAKIVPDGNGGAVIVWEDYRNDPTQTNADIYAQRIDKNGVLKWTTDGIAICSNPAHQSNPNVDAINGKIIIIWNDYRNGNADIYAQMIDTIGNILWTSNGVPVINKAYNQKDGKVAIDVSNNVYVVYQDSSGGQWDIYAQKLNASGIQQWTNNGAVVCNAGNHQINARSELVSTGGIYVVWQDKRNGADYDIYAQKLDANGIRQWNIANNGIYVCSTVGTQSNPKIEPFASGFITAWQDFRNGADYDIYAQYIDNAGIAQWTTNGKLICNAIDNQSAIDIKNNTVDGAYIVWKDKRTLSFYDIYIQKITYTGTLAWAINGIVLSNAAYDQINPNIAIDPSGDALVVWQDSSAGSWDIYASRVSKTGAVLWTTLVSNAANNQTDPKNVSDETGGSIIAWQDNRNKLSTKWDIYAQKVFSNGSLSSIAEQLYNVKIKVWPNPSNNILRIHILNGFQKQYTIELHNIVGDIIWNTQTSESRTDIDISNLPTSVYMLIIKDQEQIIYTSKIIKE